MTEHGEPNVGDAVRHELDRNIDLIRKLNLPIRIEVHENF